MIFLTSLRSFPKAYTAEELIVSFARSMLLKYMYEYLAIQYGA